MILRRLSLFGFKSFAEKTELEFGAGMTAVIGPNGCGKSNVVDAIRWVLGEQKVTVLRSASMSDVIFSGTQNRQPLNMAEVTLTIENDKGILPVEYGEVAISRRIFRSGECEYRINKVPCRLRDIHDLFIDTGVGSSVYTTIERGMIDSILSDKAEERRVLFEEASGIGKYKHRRKESLRQLDKTRQDLLRINDKVQEADRQVRMLARHVEKAQRFKTYREDLKRLEIGHWNRSFVALTEALALRAQKIEESVAGREALRARISAMESQIEKMRLFALEKEKDLEIASRHVSEANERIIRLDRDLSVAAERAKSLSETVAVVERDMQVIDTQMEENSALRTQVETCIVGRESDHRRCAERMVSMKNEIEAFDSRLCIRRDETDALARNQIDIINVIGNSKDGISACKSTLAAGLAQQERNRQELQSLHAREDECREAVETCQKQLTAADEENRTLVQSRQTLVARINKEDERYQGLIEREKRLEAQGESSTSQLRFLEGLDAAFEGYEGGIKMLLKAMPEGLRGSVADLIRVSDEANVALIEKTLGGAVQTAVFDTEEHLRAAMLHLQGEKSGAARMVALDRIAHDAAPAVPAAALGTPMQSMVTTAADCEALADYLLSGVMVTESGEEALAFSRTHDALQTFVGRDGVICKGDGTVIAGQPQKEQPGILARKIEMEKLTAFLDRCAKEHAATIQEKEICIINRDEAKKALVEVDERLNKGQRFSQEQQAAIRHYGNELEVIGEKVNTLLVEGGDLEVKITRAEADIAVQEAGVAAQQGRLAELEARLEETRKTVRAMEDERRVLADRLKNHELEVQGLHNRLQQDRQDVERLIKENILAFERKQRKLAEKQKAEAEAIALADKADACRQEQTALVSRRTSLEAARDGIREEYSGRLIEIDELRKVAKIEQSNFEEISNQIHANEIEQTRDEQEQRRIRERIWEAWEVDLTAPVEELPVISEAEAEVLQQIDMLRERLRRVGEVNMAAYEDYETESKRFNELSAQRDDLQKAVDDLEHAIRKLDKEARAQFLATFELVQKHFTDMFTSLFEGGEANVSLEENVDPLEAAIHINVRPAGKKMRGVQMLSAGERALTAISLLFALYLVKPSAYCILDELDAPLDEANTVRFINVVRKFAANTQFIVITHNKRTMEASDMLYGVTQCESGVSTIVSVKFDDAERQAA
jgi:chromosome segregation protein